MTEENTNIEIKQESIEPSLERRSTSDPPSQPSPSSSRSSKSSLPPSYIPSEFLRTPSGSSVIDTESITDDSGRTYHGYKEGKYTLPNDAVSLISGVK
jgi:hypothetical protein